MEETLATSSGEVVGIHGDPCLLLNNISELPSVAPKKQDRIISHVVHKFFAGTAKHREMLDSGNPLPISSLLSTHQENELSNPILGKKELNTAKIALSDEKHDASSYNNNRIEHNQPESDIHEKLIIVSKKMFNHTMGVIDGVISEQRQLETQCSSLNQQYVTFPHTSAPFHAFQSGNKSRYLIPPVKTSLFTSTLSPLSIYSRQYKNIEIKPDDSVEDMIKKITNYPITVEELMIIIQLLEDTLYDKEKLCYVKTMLGSEDLKTRKAFHKAENMKSVFLEFFSMNNVQFFIIDLFYHRYQTLKKVNRKCMICLEDAAKNIHYFVE